MMTELEKLDYEGKRYVLLKNDMEFYYVAIQDLKSGDVKYSAAIITDAEGIRQFDASLPTELTLERS